MEELVRDLGTLGEPARIRLLAALDQQELGVGELCRVVQAPQSTVSRHLKVLQTSGFVRRRSEGTHSLWRVEALDGERAGLWALCRASFGRTRLAEEDLVRLRAVLAARDSGSFFSTRAEEWDGLRRDLFGDAFLLAAVASLLDPELVVADLGCGTGVALVELAPVVARAIGIDREAAMLDAARARLRDHGNVELRQGGLEDLPLPDAAVDCATCLLVLHHVPDLRRVFGEIARILRPGGRLVVVDMVAHDRSDWTHTMGHRHLGFGPGDLEGPAATAGLVAQRRRALPVVDGASGPPLFLAGFRKPR